MRINQDHARLVSMTVRLSWEWIMIVYFLLDDAISLAVLLKNTCVGIVRFVHVCLSVFRVSVC